jgi:glycosyltransferase involved in cell wall biosynthesis
VWLFEKLIPLVYRDTPFVALSDSTAADLRRRGVRTSAMHIVPPGLDLTRYTPGTPPRSDEPLVVYVGRLKRYKGLDFVLEAFARVRRTLTNARFVLVGKGDDRARLEALATRLGLGDAVQFTGFVSENDKIAWLRRATTVVYPSPREGWGLSTIEAAACGTPVIASDSEGLRDAVRSGQTGFLLPHRDVAAWAARITAVLTDHALRQRMGAAGRAWAMQFDWNAGAAQLCRIVESLAGRNGRVHA